MSRVKKVVRVPQFKPSDHAFQFVNRFPGIPLPDAIQEFVDTSRSVHGLCGGMCFAVIDHRTAGKPLPNITEIPEPGTPLYEYLHARQMDSWGMGKTQVLRYVYWMTLSDNKAARESLENWEDLQENLQQGAPTVLGLVYHDIGETIRVWDNHQVLAHGFSEMDDGTFHIHLYDPNYANRDDVYIRVTPTTVTRSNGKEVPAVALAQNIGSKKLKEIHGFFLVPYKYQPPPDNLSA